MDYKNEIVSIWTNGWNNVINDKCLKNDEYITDWMKRIEKYKDENVKIFYIMWMLKVRLTDTATEIHKFIENKLKDKQIDLQNLITYCEEEMQFVNDLYEKAKFYSLASELRDIKTFSEMKIILTR